MRSAVVIAKNRAEGDPRHKSNNSNYNDRQSTASPGVGGIVQTPGATYDNGKVYLRGNPLHTTPEVFCPNCRLPRLLYPPFGNGSRPLPDPHQEYCRRLPPITLAGVDAHGNQFATDKITRKKKIAAATGEGSADDAAARSAAATATTSTEKGAPAQPPKHSTAHSHHPTAGGLTPDPSPVSFPMVKCPNCPRYFVTSRVAQHLDRCMGLSNSRRGAATAASAAVSNNNNTRNRASTPPTSLLEGVAGSGPGSASGTSTQPNKSSSLKKKRAVPGNTVDDDASVSSSGDTVNTNTAYGSTSAPALAPSAMMKKKKKYTKKNNSNKQNSGKDSGTAATGGTTVKLKVPVPHD